MEPTITVYVINLRFKLWKTLETYLNPVEWERGTRFKFECDRQAFTIVRARLRQILATQLKVLPQDVRFKLGEYGKPHLIDDSIDFNVSHSGDFGLIAISTHYPVGIDIEQERSDFNFESIAQRQFSFGEQKIFSTLPSVLKKKSFFLCWSRKEAFIKAIGMGLSFPLKQFEVSLDPRQLSPLLTIHKEGVSKEWILHHLEVASGYSAALVTFGPAKVDMCLDQFNSTI